MYGSKHTLDPSEHTNDFEYHEQHHMNKNNIVNFDGDFFRKQWLHYNIVYTFQKKLQ